MTLYTTLKQNSKLALRENWGRAILGLLIIVAASVVLTLLRQVGINLFILPLSQTPTMETVSFWDIVRQSTQILPVELGILAISLAASLLVAAPLQLGLTRWHWMLVHGKSMPVSSVFAFFDTKKQYTRAVGYALSMTLRTLFWALLFYLLPALAFGVSGWFLRDTGETLSRGTVAVATAGLMLSGILFLLSTVLYLAYMEKYTLTPYLLFESQEATVSQSIKTSVIYSKGYRFPFLLFRLSFIGWIVLVPFTFGLILLYAEPYINTSVAMYGRYIIERSRYVPDVTKEFVVEPSRETP